MGRTLPLLASLCLVGCGGPTTAGWGGGGEAGLADDGTSASTTSGRDHGKNEDGAWHAYDNEYPFLCLDASGSPTTCPDDVWPETERLSCDAAGCHGSYDYDPATPQSSRNLDGSAGPSCWTCHDKEWSDAKTGNGGGDEDDEDEDDEDDD